MLAIDRVVSSFELSARPQRSQRLCGERSALALHRWGAEVAKVLRREKSQSETPLLIGLR
jgi:hypothetical protein